MRCFLLNFEEDILILIKGCFIIRKRIDCVFMVRDMGLYYFESDFIDSFNGFLLILCIL